MSPRAPGAPFSRGDATPDAGSELDASSKEGIVVARESESRKISPGLARRGVTRGGASPARGGEPREGLNFI